MSEIMKGAAEEVLDITKGQSGKMLERIFGPSFDELGLILAERIRGRRLKQEIKLLQEAEAEIAARGIKTKRIALKNFVPLLEYSSIEEDETIHEKWKAMLVNYVDTQKNFETNVFPNILSQISKEEFDYLTHIANHTWDAEKYNTDGFREKKPAIEQNLLRLGVLKQDFELLMKSSFRMPDTKTDYGYGVREYSPIKGIGIKVRLSPIGKLFLDICSLEQKK